MPTSIPRSAGAAGPPWSVARTAGSLTALVLAIVVGAGPSRAGEALAKIPFEIEDNRIVFPMRVGDSPEMKILFDTGATLEGVYLFHDKWIDELGLSGGVERSVAGAGGDDPTRTFMKEGVTLEAGGLRFEGQRVYVSRSPRTQRFPRDGVAGGTLLRNHVVEIDQGAKTITLYDRSAFEPDHSWKPLEMELRKGIPWITVHVRVRDEPEAPASVYLDSAAGEALLLLVRPEMRFRVPEDAERRYIGTGLSGDVYGRFANISSVRIGPYRVEDVLTAFPPADVRSKQEGADGIIGNDLLCRFDWIFDYSRSRIYLKPIDIGDDPER